MEAVLFLTGLWICCGVFLLIGRFVDFLCHTDYFADDDDED